jgi:hypothetical protein
MKTKRIVMIALAALVALSAVGIASAQGLEKRGDGDRPRGRGDRHPILRGLHHVAAAVTEATGLERADIVAQLAEGKTLAEVIAENGGDVETVKTELLAPLQERAAAAVENERITQERADELLANAGERIDALLNRVFERLPEIYERRQERHNQLENEI